MSVAVCFLEVSYVYRLVMERGRFHYVEFLASGLFYHWANRTSCFQLMYLHSHNNLQMIVNPEENNSQRSTIIHVCSITFRHSLTSIFQVTFET